MVLQCSLWHRVCSTEMTPLACRISCALLRTNIGMIQSAGQNRWLRVVGYVGVYAFAPQGEQRSFHVLRVAFGFCLAFNPENTRRVRHTTCTGSGLHPAVMLSTCARVLAWGYVAKSMNVHCCVLVSFCEGRGSIGHMQSSTIWH